MGIPGHFGALVVVVFPGEVAEAAPGEEAVAGGGVHVRGLRARPLTGMFLHLIQVFRQSLSQWKKR